MPTIYILIIVLMFPSGDIMKFRYRGVGEAFTCTTMLRSFAPLMNSNVKLIGLQCIRQREV